MRVLFVCTGNIFRSLSAHYLLQKYSNHTVSSAGINPIPMQYHKGVTDELKELGVSFSDHHQRKVTQEIVNNHDLIISMAKNHQEYLKNHFNTNSILFNKICFNKEESMPDVEDVIENHKEKPKEVYKFVRETVRTIDSGIKILKEKIKRK